MMTWAMTWAMTWTDAKDKYVSKKDCVCLN